MLGRAPRPEPRRDPERGYEGVRKAGFSIKDRPRMAGLSPGTPPADGEESQGTGLGPQ